MASKFHGSTVINILMLALLSGLSVYLMLPMIVGGLLTDFTASLIATAITLPLIRYLLKEPEGEIKFHNYMTNKGLSGFLIDLILILISAFAPAVIIMYFLLSLRVILPVPLAVAASVGVYMGYAAFLYRNRGLYESDKLDVNF